MPLSVKIFLGIIDACFTSEDWGLCFVWKICLDAATGKIDSLIFEDGLNR